MLELQHSPLLANLPRRKRSLTEDKEQENDENSSLNSLPGSPGSTNATPNRMQRFSRSRLQRKFKARALVKAAPLVATTTTNKTLHHHHHHHNHRSSSKDVQKRSSTIARVWDTLATVRWSNSNKNLNVNKDALIAKLEQLKSAAEAADLKNDGGCLNYINFLFIFYFTYTKVYIENDFTIYL